MQNSVKVNCVYILLALNIHLAQGHRPESTLISSQSGCFACVKGACACSDIDIAAVGMNDIKFNAANLSRRTPQRVDMPHTLTPPPPRRVRARTHAQV